MRMIRTFFGLAAAGAFALVGCGGEARDATSKELAALTAEISKLRAQQAALDERLDAVERSSGKVAPEPSAEPKPKAPSAAPVQQSLDADRPALDVVRLGPSPDAEDVDGDVDADGPRTVLRSGGGGIVVEETSSGGASRVLPDGSGAAKKNATKKSDKSDKSDRRKTASVAAP